MENIWTNALSILKSEVNDQVFSAWFLPIKQVAANDSSITLGVPNNFFELWIREKYISLIKTAIQQAAGKNLDLHFSIVAVVPSENNPAPPVAAGSDPSPGKTMSSRAPATAVGVSSPPEKGDKEKEYGVGWLRSVFGGPRPVPESRYQKIGLNPRYTFDNFVVGSNNRFAHAAAMAVCEKLSKVYNPLFLYGGVGLGKTHLMQSMGHEIHARYPRAKVLYITSEEFTNQLIAAIRKKETEKFRDLARNVDVLLVDDIQFIAGKNSTQEEFFHTFNALYDARKQIVLSSDRTPKDIPRLEERLVSRFEWGLVTDLQAPDMETRIAILRKKAEADNTVLPDDVIFFIADKIKSNVRKLEGALNRIIAFSSIRKVAITMDMVETILQEIISAEESQAISIALIQKKVAEYYDIRLADMMSKRRPQAIAFPRQVAMYFSRHLTKKSLPEIGNAFGGRDHTTIIHACKKVQSKIKNDQSLRRAIGVIERRIRS